MSLGIDFTNFQANAEQVEINKNVKNMLPNIVKNENVEIFTKIGRASCRERV